ncbi:MAG: MFS transporter, partial [Candidatus Latescibacteria bacterium]|nr:MFS transporter [Candidatus Latescibacterota bacterium]
TTVLAAVLPIYYASLVPETGVSRGFGAWSWQTSAESLWGYTVAMSAAMVAVVAPVLGAMSDGGWGKKPFLALFCYLGCLATAGLVLVSTGDYWLASGLFIVGNVGFSGGNVFYNGILRDLASDDEIDSLSGVGFAAGYVGGGLLLAVNLAMIQKPQLFGLSSTEWATRVSFVTVGVWWALWALPIFRWTSERTTVAAVSVGEAIGRAVRQVVRTLRELRNYRDLFVMLIAFLLYNDGIQTVIVMASIYGKQALSLSTGDLIGTLMMIQVIGAPGAVLCGRAAARWGAKPTLLVTLTLWLGAVIYAYTMTTAAQFWGLGAVIALILGGSQAISRSLFASMVPKDRSAEFFGFFSVSGKLSSIFGPLLFALIADLTGNTRSALLSLTVLFLAGGLVLTRVNVARGRRLVAAGD